MSLIRLIKQDLFRYTGKGDFVKTYFLIPGFKYTCILRLIQAMNKYKYLFIVTYMLKMKLLSMQKHYGIQIPWNTRIGKGFYIGPFGTIVINGATIIGDNVNISHGVTIGQSNRGSKKGTAIIGNEVYIGPGAKIIGHVVIGNNVAIGANAVVTKDVPDNACVVGVPARVISMEGATSYINRKV